MFNFLRPRADRNCLVAAGLAMKQHFADSLEMGCSLYETTQDEIEDTINRNVEGQMIVVSLSTSLLNYCLTDAYYDAGKASFFEGKPETRFSHDDSRLALHTAWSLFATCKANLDMRYRYIYVNKLHSHQEEALWRVLKQWSERNCRDVFEFERQFPVQWVGFIEAISKRNTDRAMEIISE